MNITKTYRTMCQIHGAIVLAGSAGHVAWAFFFQTYGEMRGLSTVQLDLVMLFNGCICLFLFFLALISFAMARLETVTLGQMRLFAVFIIGFWFIRLILEFVFPVKIPFIVIPEPTHFLKMLVCIGILLPGLPEMLRLINSKSSMTDHL